MFLLNFHEHPLNGSGDTSEMVQYSSYKVPFIFDRSRPNLRAC